MGTVSQPGVDHYSNLVMSTAGAFEGNAAAGEQSLAEMTKAVISSWGVPELAPLWEEAVGGGVPAS